MKKAAIVLLFVIAAVSAFELNAQNYAIEMKNDKKVIHISSLGLPGNTPLSQLLKMMPEFINRDGDNLMDGYDIQIEGKSVSDLRDMIITKILLSEIDRVEISDSPIASQQRNGTAGTINIVPIKAAEGTSGLINASASTIWGVIPSISVNRKTKKLEIRGNIGVEQYNPVTSTVFEKDEGLRSIIGTDTTRRRYFSEAAWMNVKYKPTDSDELSFLTWENFDSDRIEHCNFQSVSDLRPDLAGYAGTGGEIYEHRYESSVSKSAATLFNFSAQVKYAHTFEHNVKLELTGDYVFSKNCSSKGDDPLRIQSKPQTVRGGVKFIIPFHSDGAKTVKMEVGGNGNSNTAVMDGNGSKSLDFSPYLILKYESSPLNASASFKYILKERANFVKDQHELRNSGSDYTWDVKALWQLAPHDAIRIMALRNIITPSLDKFNPTVVWNPDIQSYVKGNPALKSATLHTFNLSYIFDRQVRQSYFVTELNFGYNRADGLVEEYSDYDGDHQMFYNSFRNSGINDIFNVKANFTYRYDRFSASLSANFYHNNIRLESGRDKFNYFNISFSPVVDLGKGWTINGQVLYNSKVQRENLTLGDCLYSSLNLCKAMDRWTLRIALSDIFDYQTDDIQIDNKKDGASVIRSSYDLYKRFVGIGITYRFGK